MMQITVIIVTHNNATTIARALYGVYQHPRVNACIIIDNNSTDNTVSVIESRFPEVQLVQHTLDMGFGAACNHALLMANTELALIVNPNAAIQSQAINALIESFEQHPKMAMACSIAESNDDAPAPPSLPKTAGSLFRNTHIEKNPQYHIDGAIALMRLRHMKAVGLYNPAFFLNFNEEDILTRIRQNGYESLLLEGENIFFIPTPRFPKITQYLRRIKNQHSDPTLPVYDYWDSRFEILKQEYEARPAQLDEQLAAKMHVFKQQEKKALAAHKRRINKGLKELHKIPKSQPEEQARWDAILQKHQDDWQERVKQHEKAVNQTLKAHGKAHADIGKIHDKRWKTLERRKDEYLKAFSRAGRALTSAQHYLIFAIDPEQKITSSDSITIAIITYQRPALLKKSLNALKKLIPPPDSTIRVLIVDNDAQQSAKETFKTLKKKLPFKVEYAVEAERGIPQARNKALEIATDDDYLAFIDDDDLVDPYWLCFLLQTARIYHADVVMGEVKYKLESNHQHLSHLDIFRPTGKHTGQPVDNASTNNVLFATSLYREQHLKFDTAFTATGGSDHHFFRTAQANGARIIFCAEAIVNSPVPHRRTRLKWIVRRYLRYGAIRSISNIKHRGHLYAVSQTIFYIFDSGLYFLRMLWWAAWGKQPFIHPLMILCYIAGSISGLAKISPYEYQKDWQ